MNRIMWPLGILLLVVTIVGTFWALSHTTPHVGANGKGDADVDKQPTEVFCLGNVDVPDGIAELYPKQFGQVVKIAETRTKDGKDRVFKTGEVLLWVDRQMAERLLAKARIAEKAAADEVAKAKLLAPERTIKIEMQKAAISAIEHEKKKLQADLDTKLKAFKESIGSVTKEILTQAQESLAALDDKIKIENGTLKLLDLSNPELDLNRALADLDAKKLDVQIAETALQDFQIVAPFDGIILRVHTRVGELLGPNPRAPAIEFCPDVPRIVRAEVIQEWGHRVHEGQEAIIEDDTYKGPVWQGRVKSISPWYAQKRMRVIEPFNFNDVRTMDCIVEITAGLSSPIRIGQRMRVKIKI